MTFAIPSLADIVQRVRLGFRSELKGSDAAIWPNNVYATAKAVGGALDGLFKRLDIVRRDIHAHTAGLDGVLEHAAEYGVARKPPVPATGPILVATLGATAFAKGAQVLRSDGAVYLTTQAYATAGIETFALSVYAEDAGAAGNTDEGADLTPGDGVTGLVDSIVAGTGGLIGGAEAEDIGTSLRARVLFRKRFPIHGGAPPDYVSWATEVPGVTRVYVTRKPNGPGTVAVYPLFDDSRENGIPTDADLDLVREHLDLKAPSDADVYVVGAIPFPIDVTLSGLQPASEAVKTAIEVELSDMMLRRGRVSGTDPGHPAMPFLASPLTFSVSWLRQAVSDAAGEDRHVMTGPTVDPVIPVGRIPVLGNIFYVA